MPASTTRDWYFTYWSGEVVIFETQILSNISTLYRDETKESVCKERYRVPYIHVMRLQALCVIHSLLILAVSVAAGIAKLQEVCSTATLNYEAVIPLPTTELSDEPRLPS